MRQALREGPWHKDLRKGEEGQEREREPQGEAAAPPLPQQNPPWRLWSGNGSAACCIFNGHLNFLCELCGYTISPF